MPTYLYKNIDTGEIYELRQSMRDEAYVVHPESGVPVKRVLARPGIAFKGSGFYVNDSRPGGGESSGAPADKTPAKAPDGGARSGGSAAAPGGGKGGE